MRGSNAKHRISIIDIDSKIPNLALKKIEKYHLDRGDEVVWNSDLFIQESDKTYVSCVFSKNRTLADKYNGLADIGGSGYSLDTVLPPEIEIVNPHINLGFTTRGCVRNCPFCIVPKKEGRIRIVGDLLDLWDGKSKEIVVMDNNILALHDHFSLVCRQAQDNRLLIDFNQGLDHRLLTPEIADTLKRTRHKEYRFSFDYSAQEPSVRKAIDIMSSVGINRCSWYVLAGFESSFDDALYRANLLRGLNQIAYLQRYESCYHDKKYILLARWVNQHHLFRALTWEQFKARPENAHYLPYA